MEQLATFTCKTSKSNVEVTWYKDHQEVKPNDKYELRHLGREHNLTVHDLCMSDFGDYAVSIRSLKMFAHGPAPIGLSFTSLCFKMFNMQHG